MTVFANIIGHDPIVERLRQALGEGRLGHAWLFYGPAGVGKRAMATALVQSLFCATKSALGGCGECASCRRCVTGNHPDLQCLELQDKKVRISVDQVRDLTRFVAFTPLESAWKAAIVDDAALMNDAGANALLKTLEEPPSGSLLILITNHPGELLPTLWSRCQSERFVPLSAEQILTILAREVNDVPLAERQEAARLATGRVGEAIRLCQKGALETRRQLFRDLDALPKMALAELLEMANGWSQADTFFMMPTLLQTWFRERIRDNVLQEEENRLDIERWLEASTRTGQLVREAHIFNLNPRLTLETIFIRLARMQGAAF